MSRTSGSRKALSRIVGARIVVFALLAMLIQAVVVIIHTYSDDTQLADQMIEHESGALSKGLGSENGRVTFVLPHSLSRYTTADHGYFTRIRTSKGAVIYSDCEDRCELHLLPQGLDPPDSWSRMLRHGKPIAVAGGRTFNVEGQRVVVELAVIDDHERVMRRVLGAELADDLAVPMGLTLVFSLGGMLFSVRLALRPVERAAKQAETIDPLDPSHTIDVRAMPREIADLGEAVNRMLVRISNLMNAQRVYTTAVAHEIRTPLAMMKLELGHIDHPRARKIESDLDGLTHLVTQITDLGRLEAADRASFKAIDLAGLAGTVVADIAPWVYDHHHRIAFEDAASTPVEGHAALVENALRNLIENAVKHTPVNTGIQVTAGPGARVSISDEAGLSTRESAATPIDGRREATGIGLEVVRRIMVLHNGHLTCKVEPGQRTTMHLIFTPQHDHVPHAGAEADDEPFRRVGQRAWRSHEPTPRPRANGLVHRRLAGRLGRHGLAARKPVD